MKALDGIEDAALIALDGAKGPYLGVAVVMSGGLPTAPAPQVVLALRRRLTSFFPKGTVPKRYRFVAELPRNAQGKVRVAALRALFTVPASVV